MSCLWQRTGLWQNIVACSKACTARLNTCNRGNARPSASEPDSCLISLLHKCSSCKLGTLACIESTCNLKLLHCSMEASSGDGCNIADHYHPTDLRPVQVALVEDQDAQCLVWWCTDGVFWTWHSHDVSSQVDTSQAGQCYA